ncbi:MAG: type II toxin-antitoxin system death-on-curing family toxin [Clostridia bacterium]|nr:type II toxin-antitoxin system death-on-curing family toxin [Clostridia bacterium]
MIKIDSIIAQRLHQLLISETGGSPNLRDGALLDSALESIFQTFGGQELYPTLAEKGARLGFSLISNHAFVDGNKRIGALIMLVFLEVNGYRVDFTDEDIIKIGLGVASGAMSYEELLEIIIESKI